MIQTKSFSLTPKKYFGIVLWVVYKRSWWLKLAMIVLSTIFLIKGPKDNFEYFIIAFGYTYPLLTIFYLYFWVNNKKNGILFLPRTVKLEEENLYFEMEDGISSTIPVKHITKVVEHKDYLMLYITQRQFNYIEKAAFENEEEYLRFRDAVMKVKS